MQNVLKLKRNVHGEEKHHAVEEDAHVYGKERMTNANKENVVAKRKFAMENNVLKRMQNVSGQEKDCVHVKEKETVTGNLLDKLEDNYSVAHSRKLM